MYSGLATGGDVVGPERAPADPHDESPRLRLERVSLHSSRGGTIRPVHDFIEGTGLAGLFMIELLRDEKGRRGLWNLTAEPGEAWLWPPARFVYPTWAVRLGS